MYSVPLLRIEPPLVDLTLGDKRRSEVFKEIKDHVLPVANVNFYDFVEMELSDRIDSEIFFPSSLSTVWSFNRPEDYGYLKDDTLRKSRRLFTLKC
jgi:hypothetical protein